MTTGWSAGTVQALKNRAPLPASLPMIDRIIRAGTEAGDVVLAPFMGSGTAGEAALASGRNFIGVEQDAKLLSISKKRLRAIRGTVAAAINAWSKIARAAAEGSSEKPSGSSFSKMKSCQP